MLHIEHLSPRQVFVHATKFHGPWHDLRWH